MEGVRENIVEEATHKLRTGRRRRRSGPVQRGAFHPRGGSIRGRFEIRGKFSGIKD